MLAPATFTGSTSSQAVGSAAANARTAASTVSGTWRRLSPAPVARTPETVSVWTGRQMLIFGRAQQKPPMSVDVAAAYNPASDTWHRLAPFKGPSGNFQGHYTALWTGKEMLTLGPFDLQAFDPLTNHWRRLPAEPAGNEGGGLRVWTGHEMINWGGGCCGDASSIGYAFNPTTNTWRKLAPSPLAPSQNPSGAWTGRELIILVNGIDPDGKPYPASLARIASYNPTTNTWRRIAPLPAPRSGATIVWDGREVLVVGGYGTPTKEGKPPPLARIGNCRRPDRLAASLQAADARVWRMPGRTILGVDERWTV